MSIRKANEVMGSLALRRVGQVTFLEDSNGIIHVAVSNLVWAKDVDQIEVAQWIADAVNAYKR